MQACWLVGRLCRVGNGTPGLGGFAYIHTRRTRMSSRLPCCSLVVILFMHASGFRFPYCQWPSMLTIHLASRLVRVRSRAEVHGATYGPEVQGTMLPQGKIHRYLLRQRMPARHLGGWRRCVGTTRSHPVSTKATLRAQLTRQAGSERAWADWGHAISPLYIPRLVVTNE